MGSWHTRARLGVAIFGVVVAVIVYAAMRERPAAAPQQPVRLADPKAVLEIESSSRTRFAGTDKNFELSYEFFTLYDDGTKKVRKPVVIVHQDEGRTFSITAAEGVLSEDENQIELIGDVRLTDSDGFTLTTDRATVQRQHSIARIPGAVTFSRGRMTGSGLGVTYDMAGDVLTILEQAQVTTTDESGAAAMAFTAGTAVLDRVQHVLTLDGNVHVMRHEEALDADRAVARLSAADDVVQFIELRGNARVQGGGGGVDAMSARDIDLDYSDDGQQLEAMTLTGAAAAALVGASGSQQIEGESVRATFAADGAKQMLLTGNAEITETGAGGGAGRTIAGARVELDIAADGTLTRAVGRENVRLDLPASAAAPGRSIRAAALDGTGTAGRGLTAATFSGGVVYSEGAATGRGSARTARAQTLQAEMADDEVTSAIFTGEATFEEAGLKACTARMEYQPAKGTLALHAAAGSRPPIVADEQVAIEAREIAVALGTRRMRADGSVTTQMGGASSCQPAVARPASARHSRRPGLLKADGVVTIMGAALDYDGEAGTATYSGRAALSQGGTAIHADTMTIDQRTGDVTASGDAILTIALDGDASIGRAHEIRYVDASRRVVFAGPPPGTAPRAAPAAAPARGRGAAAPASEPELAAELGNLRAGRIEIVLAAEEGRAELIEAATNVRLTRPGRTATGTQFTYDPERGAYVMRGDGAAPAQLVDRQGATCRTAIGRSLTFYSADDRIEIDGQDRNRTQIAPGPCPAPTR